VLVRRLRRAERTTRRLRVLVVVLAAAAAALAAGTAHHPPDIRLSPDARAATVAAPPLFPAPMDPTFDDALRDYAPLRRQPVRRRTLTAQILAAAAEHRVDPDLLFAVVAVESGFDTRAVSRRGARGLGQLLFSTARALAPGRVRRPADLHDPTRNLDATARLLRSLLERHDGDLDPTLRAYYGGPWDRGAHLPDRERYWLKVAGRYAALKAQRAHRALQAADRRPRPAAPVPAERGEKPGI
jgi:soluble lytic murein transglycosylase-like protein